MTFDWKPYITLNKEGENSYFGIVDVNQALHDVVTPHIEQLQQELEAMGLSKDLKVQLSCQDVGECDS